MIYMFHVFFIFISSFGIVCCGREIIRVRFMRLSIEKEQSCLFDSVSLYDGSQENVSRRIGRFCGHRRPADIVSSGPVLLISLTTDNTINEGGFNITWTSESSKG